MATGVEIDASDLGAIGDLQWPVPIAFDQGGGIAGFGYENEVLLLQDLRVKESVETDQGLSLGVTVSWLACKNVCVLGAVELSEVLPLATAKRNESRAILEQWQGRFPQAGNNIPSLGTRRLIGRWSETGGPSAFTLWLSWDKAPASIEWYPDPGENLKITDVRVRQRANLTRVDFKAKKIGPSSGAAESLRSLLVVERKNERKGYVLPIELGS
jgi:hypothetical protein